MTPPVLIAAVLCTIAVVLAAAANVFPAWVGDAIGMVSCLALMVWGLWFIDKQRDSK